LECGQGRRSTVTDVDGLFYFTAIAGDSRCELSVEHPHFNAYRGAISEATADLLVRMDIAPVKESVTVSATPDEDMLLTRSTLSSVSLGENELRQISNNTESLIRYAKLLAGASIGPDAVYVDGLPASTLPDAQTIATLTVNATPFSAEYADGDQTHIEITTKNPDRQLRLNFGGASLGAGGDNPLAGGTNAKSNSGNWNLSGPVPLLPVSFSAQVTFATSATPLAIEAAPPAVLFPGGQWAPANVTSSNHSAAGSVHFYFYPNETVRAHASFSESHFGGTNIGAGSLVVPQAGSRSGFTTRDLLFSIRKTFPVLLLSGGIVYSATGTDVNANSDAVGVTVPGAFTAGGAAISQSTSRHVSWTAKTTVQGTSSSSWIAGVSIGHLDDAVQQIPNPYGILQFDDTADYLSALNGQNTGVLLVTRGSGVARLRTSLAAPFFQRQLLKKRNLIVNAGIRADYQSGYGALLSPRLSAATEWHKFVFRSGGGVFVEPLPNPAVLSVLQDEGLYSQQYLAENVSFGDLTSVEFLPRDQIRSQLGPGITRPRHFMVKNSIERSFGNFTAGTEYTWTRGEHLLGSRRLVCDDGWLDFLESDRESILQRIRSQLTYRIKGQRLVTTYDWTHSRDDTGGAFSFPAGQNDIRSEWARSAGIAPHTFTSAALLQLPGRISTNLTESWHGSAPYNITTGLDPANDGLYTDRGGLPRNSGNGPDFRSVALYISRRVAFPNLGPSRWRLAVRIGLQVENLLDSRNYTSVGSVMNSPTFGVPLSALPGRSLRLWINLD
jgi:hypothetical protein